MLIYRLHAEPIELWQNKLDGEDFTKVNFHRCILDKYNMNKSYFKGCDFRSAQMNAVNFDETFMSGTRLIMVKSVNSSYKGANFVNSLLLYSDFSYTNFTDVNFSEAILKESNFEGCNFCGAMLLCEQIESCNFKGAIFDDTTVWGNGFNPIEYGAIYKNHLAK